MPMSDILISPCHLTWITIMGFGSTHPLTCGFVARGERICALIRVVGWGGVPVHVRRPGRQPVDRKPDGLAGQEVRPGRPPLDE
jgi:hypothetical protein